MSKKIKNLITRELTQRLDGIESLGVINPRGINAVRTNLFRRKLHANNLRMTVVKNTLVRRAVQSVADSKLKGFDALLDGPSAVIYGQSSISQLARLLVEEKKENNALELRGIFFDGEIYAGEQGVEQVSKLPTREEAIANVLGAILGPGRKLAAAVKGPGGKLGAVLKTIEEKAGGSAEAAPAA
ncbi:MAG: 50S ribosomal protein L10 [Phycisphaerales bacterium]|nr:50S ribosomal protein L10 [Phycisphaerales bacterium]